MAQLTFLGKTVDALHLLRQAQCPLPKDVRTLLILIDGARHERELKRLAASNGVASFEENLAYLRKEGLIQELGDTVDEGISIDTVEADYAKANLITMDFTRSGFLNNLTNENAPRPRADSTPAAPAKAIARTDTGTPAVGANPSATQQLQAQQQQQELRAKLIAHLRPGVEEELRARLLPDLRTALVRELTVKLEAALRPQIAKRLYAKLEAELRPRIEQELRARLETETAAVSRLPASYAPAADTEAEAVDAPPRLPDTSAAAETHRAAPHTETL